MMKKAYERVSFASGMRFVLNGKICKVTRAGFSNKIQYDTWHSRNAEENTHHVADITTLERLAEVGIITHLTEKHLSHAQRVTA